MTEPTENRTKVSLLKHLLERRFPQIIFVYLGVCWTTLEFISWIVDHYTISPYIIDFSFITLISMIPTVGLLAYFHGKPGPDSWHKIEKIGIPLNVTITIVLLVSLFSGKELGSTTKDAYLEDESGTELARSVPKQDFMKRLAIFFFENEDEVAELDWMQYGIMFACHLDLVQDPFFSVYSAYDYMIYQKIMQAGFGERIDIPMALEKKIAREIQRKYFLGGSYTVAGDTIVLKSYLYETDNGRLLAENVFRGTDFFHLIDDLSFQLKKDLNVSRAHIEEVVDLPVQEMSSHSLAAFRDLIRAQNVINFHNDYLQAVAFLEKAVEQDPSFTLAYWELYMAYFNTNQPQKAVAAMQSTMQYIYKLPETFRFRVKEEYYLITENPEKRQKVLEMWVQLYPKNVNAHFSLAMEHINRHRFDEAIEEYRAILQIDPERYYYLRYIGNLYAQKGDFQEALRYYQMHRDKYPDDPLSFTSLGDLYFRMGDYEKSKQYYLDALVIDPKSIATMVRLGDIEAETGNCMGAVEQYQEALFLAATSEQRAEVFQALEQVYERQGQIRKSLEYREKRFAEMARFLNPLQLAMDELGSMSFHKFSIVNRTDQARQRIAKLSSQLAEPWLKMNSLAHLDLALQQQDPDICSEYLARAEEAVELFGGPGVLALHHTRAQLAEWQGDYLNAILNYQKEIDSDPTDVRRLVNISRCYRKLKDYDRAEKFLATTLRILPYYPQAHLELAKISLGAGDYEKAASHLEVALQIWSDADAEFEPAREARALQQQLPPA